MILLNKLHITEVAAGRADAAGREVGKGGLASVGLHLAAGRLLQTYLERRFEVLELILEPETFISLLVILVKVLNILYQLLGGLNFLEGVFLLEAEAKQPVLDP